MTDLATAVAEFKPKPWNEAVVRVCNLQDVRLSIERYRLSDAQKLILYRRHGFRRKPTDKDIIQRHIDYVFSRPLTGRSDRYSKRRHALYTSLKRATAEAEMRYYARTQIFNPSLDREELKFDVIEVDFSGLAARLTSLFRPHPWLKMRTDKADTQVMGDLAADQLACLIVRSVRYSGENSVIFDATCVKPSATRTDLRLVVQRHGARRITRVLT